MTPDEIVAAIRRLYFEATAESIEQDFDRAIDLLKQLPDEESRGRAAVFMEGLAQMRSEWRGGRGPRGKRKR
ncbi:MAG TPA: hypothetical protein VIL35_08405 [Vicinamibacterales bacterium]